MFGMGAIVTWMRIRVRRLVGELVEEGTLGLRKFVNKANSSCYVYWRLYSSIMEKFRMNKVHKLYFG